MEEYMPDGRGGSAIGVGERDFVPRFAFGAGVSSSSSSASARARVARFAFGVLSSDGAVATA